MKRACSPRVATPWGTSKGYDVTRVLCNVCRGVLLLTPGNDGEFKADRRGER